MGSSNRCLKATAGSALFLFASFLILPVCSQSAPDYLSASWDPIHLPPQIETATDQQCLACHAEILDRKISPRSPAGIDAGQTLAWYQTLSTYEGDQETFHRRHLVTPLATGLMSLRCNTCHQGNDPREEAPSTVSATDGEFTLRKSVNPQVCHMCHGQFDYQVMNLPGPWTQFRDSFGNNCMTCHNVFRTSRHDVNFLNAEAIEAAGTESGDVCFGCHGGRSWYRTSYPYPRHVWPNMPPVVPEWAKDRPTQSEERFLE